jgi:hypothetical protein
MVNPKKQTTNPGTVVPPSGQPPSGNLASRDSKRIAAELREYKAFFWDKLVNLHRPSPLLD